MSGALDLNANVLESFDGGGTWDLMNANPVYVLDYSGGVEEGVSEAKQVVASNNSVFGVPAQQWIAETFTLGSSTQLSGFRVRLNAPAGGPSAPVSFTLASYSAGVLGSTIGSGNLGVINDTAFRWYTGLFGSNPTLIPGTYALAFSTTSGDSTSGYYQFSIADSSSQFSPYSGLTYDGSNSAYAISTNAGASFSANTGRDLAFELLLAPQQANLGQSWGMDTSNPGFLSRLGAAGAVFNGQMWVIGGTNDPGPNYLNDAWVSSDGFNWSQQGTLGTSGRTGAAAAVLGSPATLWVSGGSNSLNVPLSDVWANTGSGWTQQSTGAAFGGRFGHGMVSFGNKLWVIGGFNSGFLQDVWNSGDGVNWTPVTAAGPSPPRDNFGCVVYNDRIWVIGGSTSSGPINDVWSSTDGLNWTQVGTAPFSARADFGCAALDNRLWVYGGASGAVSTPVNDVWWSQDGANWTQATTGPFFTARYGHVGLTFNNGLFAIGGYNGTSSLSDVWQAPLFQPQRPPSRQRRFIPLPPTPP